MTDNLSREKRSWNMSRIRSRNTKPELRVRSLLHCMGYRFTISGFRNRTLPGRPDIVLPQYNTVIFVHGCFWHRHPRCKYAYKPKSRVEFWEAKFAENRERDRRKLRELRALGWYCIVVWECQTVEVREASLRRRLVKLIGQCDQK